MLLIEHLLLIAALLLIASIAASKLSVRLGVPALLLFLAMGMLLGSDGPGGVYYDDAWLSQAVGVVALAFILFSGGLDTDIQRIRPVLRQGLALSSVGVLITAGIVALAAHYLLGFSLLEGLLMGAIVAATDAAAVFSVLRSRGTGLKGQLKPLLELESGSNDPMAVFLTIGVIQLLTVPSLTFVDLAPLFIQQMVLGGALGYGLGAGLVWTMNRLRLEYDGLYPVLTVAGVLFVYGLTTSLGGNGFLAVYLAGLVMGNQNFIHKKSLTRFHDGLAWLMQIIMFLTLGLLVFPSKLAQIVSDGLLLAAVLILVARPVSVFVSLVFTRLGWREKLMISWVGLRGAAPIVLATFPLLAGLAKADTIFNLVFFVVLISVLLQGVSLAWVARLLRVDAPEVPKAQYPLEFVPMGGIHNELRELTIPTNSAVIGQQIVNLGLPAGSLIVLIARGHEYLVPNGSAILEAGDTLLVLADNEAFAAIKQQVETQSPVIA